MLLKNLEYQELRKEKSSWENWLNLDWPCSMVSKDNTCSASISPWELVCILVAPRVIQLPTSVPGKTAKVGDPDVGFLALALEGTSEWKISFLDICHVIF